jgi:hypothetical protein
MFEYMLIIGGFECEYLEDMQDDEFEALADCFTEGEEYEYDEDAECYCWYDEEYDAWYWLNEETHEWLLVEDDEADWEDDEEEYDDEEEVEFDDEELEVA